MTDEQIEELCGRLLRYPEYETAYDSNGIRKTGLRTTDQHQAAAALRALKAERDEFEKHYELLAKQGREVMAERDALRAEVKRLRGRLWTPSQSQKRDEHRRAAGRRHGGMRLPDRAIRASTEGMAAGKP